MKIYCVNKDTCRRDMLLHESLESMLMVRVRVRYFALVQIRVGLFQLQFAIIDTLHICKYGALGNFSWS